MLPTSSALHADIGPGADPAARYPAKINRAMIFVLCHQVKPKFVAICTKSVEKSMENNRDPSL